jgi:hypothetical protein
VRPQKPHRPQGGKPQGPKHPLPWNSAYEQAVDAARRAYGDQSAALNTRQFATTQSYGFDTDPSTNPYSRAAQLQADYDRSRKGGINSMAAGGQLYSGSTASSLSHLLGQRNQNEDALRRQYSAELAEIEQERLKAGRERDETITEAQWDRLEAAKKTEPEAQAAPGKRKKPGQRKPGGKRPPRRRQIRQAIGRGQRA